MVRLKLCKSKKLQPGFSSKIKVLQLGSAWAGKKSWVDLKSPWKINNFKRFIYQHLTLINIINAFICHTIFWRIHNLFYWQLLLWKDTFWVGCSFLTAIIYYAHFLFTSSFSFVTPEFDEFLIIFNFQGKRRLYVFL